MLEYELDFYHKSSFLKVSIASSKIIFERISRKKNKILAKIEFSDYETVLNLINGFLFIKKEAKLELNKFIVKNFVDKSKK